MSRTYKDIKRYKDKTRSRIRWETEYDAFEYWGIVYNYPDFNETSRVVLHTKYLPKAGTLTKKRKDDYSEDYWYRSTPSWWTRMRMNKPQRRKGRLWETEVVKMQIDALEETDAPGVSHKPHVYYH